MKTMLCILTVALALATSAVSAGGVSGQALFEDNCADCHETSDFKGKNPNALAETIGKIVHKEVKHRKALTLTNEEVALVASYMTGN